MSNASPAADRAGLILLRLQDLEHQRRVAQRHLADGERQRRANRIPDGMPYSNSIPSASALPLTAMRPGRRRRRDQLLVARIVVRERQNLLEIADVRRAVHAEEADRRGHRRLDFLAAGPLQTRQRRSARLSPIFPSASTASSCNGPSSLATR